MHVQPVLRNLMRSNLEKHEGRVNWGTIKKYVDRAKLPEVCKGACMANILDMCPADGQCHFRASHGLSLFNPQANQLKNTVANRFKILEEEVPSPNGRKKRK